MWEYPADFLVLGSPQDRFCPIIFGRPFLNTVNAKIDSENDVVTSTVVHKSNIRTYTPPEQVKVEPNIAIVKDCLIILMGMLFSSKVKLLELLNLVLKINIDLW